MKKTVKLCKNTEFRAEKYLEQKSRRQILLTLHLGWLWGILANFGQISDTGTIIGPKANTLTLAKEDH